MKKMMKKTKSALQLNGASRSKTPTQTALAIAKDLKNRKLSAAERVTIENPITGKKTIITLRRDGTQESELIETLANPKTTQDRKDFVLSMYLFGRGSDSASMMVDLMRYKGLHTKETRVFKSQMRFDFEMFVELFIAHLEGQAHRTAKILGINLEKEIKEYRSFLARPNNKGRELTYSEFRKSDNKERCALISEAIFSLEEVQRMQDSRDQITSERLKDKGYGVYVSKEGKSYSCDDPLINDIIREDKEATNSIKI